MERGKEVYPACLKSSVRVLRLRSSVPMADRLVLPTVLQGFHFGFWHFWHWEVSFLRRTPPIPGNAYSGYPVSSLL